MAIPTHPNTSRQSFNTLKRNIVPLHVDILEEGATDTGGSTHDWMKEGILLLST